MTSTFSRLVRYALPLVWLATLGGCVQPRGNAFETLSPNASGHAPKLTAEEAKQRIAGHTFLRNYAGRGNEALFFAPNNVVYQWVSGRGTIATSTWMVDLRSMRPTETAQPYICTNLPRGPETAGGPRVDLRSRCIDPKLLFIPATENGKGDVFGLASRREGPAELGSERTTIQDVKKAVSTGR
jgi:hypothetical protein